MWEAKPVFIGCGTESGALYQQQDLAPQPCSYGHMQYIECIHGKYVCQYTDSGTICTTTIYIIVNNIMRVVTQYSIYIYHTLHSIHTRYIPLSSPVAAGLNSRKPPLLSLSYYIY